MDSESESRRDDHWAKPVDRLHVTGVPVGAINMIEGRRLMGPLQGFGQLWQKSYSVRMEGSDVDPEEVIRVWKKHYDEFWPRTQRFYAPIAGIEPGQIGLISGGMGPVKASTGVLVIYADETSFAFMNPEGHPWAGWITFSSYRDGEAVVAQVELLIRANDPIWEIGFRYFGGNRFEDKMWHATLRNLAARFGSQGEVTMKATLIDKKRQWRNLRNLRHNAAVGSVVYIVATPVRVIRNRRTQKPG